MGKSYRESKKENNYNKGKRLKPYSSNGGGKFALEQSDSWSFANKEIVRNANRGLKKGLRQQYKKEIKKFLENN